MRLGCARNYTWKALETPSLDDSDRLTCHCQHVLLVLRTELHVVHEVLNTDIVEDAIGVDEEYKHIVSEYDVLRVHLIDQGECHLLAVSFSPMREATDGDLGSSIDDVDADRWLLELGNSERFECSQVKLIDLITIETEKDVDGSRRVIAINHGVDGGNEDVDILFEDWWVSVRE